MNKKTLIILLSTLGVIFLCCFGAIATLALSTDRETGSFVIPTNSPTVETTPVAPIVEPEEEESALTVSQEQAIGSAESYLRFTAFSREGLIEQLEFEGFSNDDATFAVDYLDVDWFEQAALSAENYLEFTNFSREGLIDQLMFEGFSREEAEYGVDQVGL